VVNCGKEKKKGVCEKKKKKQNAISSNDNRGEESNMGDDKGGGGLTTLHHGGRDKGGGFKRPCRASRGQATYSDRFVQGQEPQTPSRPGAKKGQRERDPIGRNSPETVMGGRVVREKLDGGRRTFQEKYAGGGNLKKGGKASPGPRRRGNRRKGSHFDYFLMSLMTRKE